MTQNVYVVKRRFKSLGNLFMEGHIFSETEYLQGDVVRRPKVKISDGQVIPFMTGDINNETKAARLEAYLGMSGLAEKILAALVEPEEEIQPMVKEAPKVEVKEKTLPKSVTPKITTKVAPKIVNKLNTNK